LSLLIRGTLAALRQKFHLSTCPNLAGHLSRYPHQPERYKISVLEVH
jgi:hypothetical protein